MKFVELNLIAFHANILIYTIDNEIKLN